MDIDLHNIDLDTAHESTVEMLTDYYEFIDRAQIDSTIKAVDIHAKTNSVVFMLGKVVLALLAERDANRQD